MAIRLGDILEDAAPIDEKAKQRLAESGTPFDIIRVSTFTGGRFATGPDSFTWRVTVRWYEQDADQPSIGLWLCASNTVRDDRFHEMRRILATHPNEVIGPVVAVRRPLDGGRRSTWEFVDAAVDDDGVVGGAAPGKEKGKRDAS